MSDSVLTPDYMHAVVKKGLCDAFFVPHFLGQAAFASPTPRNLVDFRINDAPAGQRLLQVRFPNDSIFAVPLAVDSAMAALDNAKLVTFTADIDPVNPHVGRFTVSVPEANWAKFIPPFLEAMAHARDEVLARKATTPPATPAAPLPGTTVEGDSLSYDHQILGCGMQQTRF